MIKIVSIISKYHLH